MWLLNSPGACNIVVDSHDHSRSRSRSHDHADTHSHDQNRISAGLARGCERKAVVMHTGLVRGCAEKLCMGCSMQALCGEMASEMH